MLIIFRGWNVSFDNFAQEIAPKIFKVHLKRVEIRHKNGKFCEKYFFLNPVSMYKSDSFVQSQQIFAQT